MDLQHISYSSVLLFLNNPAAFYSKYVLGQRDKMSTPAALVGSAFHKYMEGLHTGIQAERARENALAFMCSVTDVDWGKTGDIEQCMIKFNQLVDHYHNDPPVLGKILGVESVFMEKIGGIKLPIKCVVDLIHEENGSVVLLDWKTVSSYEEKPTPAQIVQACYYYLVVSKALKRIPFRFDIVQIKASKNSDGSPQVKTNSIYFSEHPEYLPGVKKLTKLALRQMMRKRQVFLPNVRDSYEGEEEFTRFLASVSGI